MLMKEPCFSQLRTREQLGYIVFRCDVRVSGLRAALTTA